jgi:hypothetical protein
MTTKRTAAAADPAAPDPVDVLDALDPTRLYPQPSRFNALPERTQRSILRAHLRGNKAGTISNALRKTGPENHVDDKTLRRYFASEEGKARLAAEQEAMSRE